MELSVLLAQLLGVVYAAVAVGMIFNSKYYNKMIKDILKDSGSIYLGGIMALVVGFFLVTYHNIWVKNWEVLITIIGWAALIKGILLLISPDHLIALSKKIYKNEKAIHGAGIIVLILALIFLYYGFVFDAAAEVVPAAA